LIPAYAATIHKSQGSEYPAVVIPVMTQHYAMLQRNLLYTGVTRGKRLVVWWARRRPSSSRYAASRVPAGDAAAVHARQLVLVGDVLTSGATIDTCARALLRAGARSVDVWSSPRVVAAVRTPI